MLRVIHIPGEPTRFHVESNSLECVEQSLRVSASGGRERPHLFNKLKYKLRVGDRCPKCGGQLDLRFHLVDVGAFLPVGSCACEWFTVAPRKELPVNFTTGNHMTAWHYLSTLPPEQRKQLSIPTVKKLRCQHIEAARDFCLDANVGAHMETERRPR